MCTTRRFNYKKKTYQLELRYDMDMNPTYILRRGTLGRIMTSDNLKHIMQLQFPEVTNYDEYIKLIKSEYN